MRRYRLSLMVSWATALLVASWTVVLAQSDGPGAAPDTVAPSPSTLCPSPHGGSCLGTLSAGTYETSVFETPITYTVSDGWANLEDLPGNFLLIPPGGTLDGVDAGTVDYIGIYQGVAVADATCAPRPEAGVGTTPDDIVEALAARDGLLVSEPVPVEVGGLPGRMVDIATDAGSEGGCDVPDFPGPLVPLIIGTGPASLEHAQIEGLTTRLYVLDRADTNLVIEISDVAAFPGDADGYMGVVSELEFASQ